MKAFFRKCWKFFLFSLGPITGDPKQELKVFGARVVVMLSVMLMSIALMIGFMAVSRLAMWITTL